MATRINKYLSEAGFCSRREADTLILGGEVTINGKIPAIGAKVEETDQVEVKGQRIEKSTRKKNIYLAGIHRKPRIREDSRRIIKNKPIDSLRGQQI